MSVDNEDLRRDALIAEQESNSSEGDHRESTQQRHAATETNGERRESMRICPQM